MNQNTWASSDSKGKLVIVTGAGSGIGAVTARRFRDASAAVVLTGRPREKLTNVVSQVRSGTQPGPCFRRDQTRRATRQCAPVLMKVRDRLTTSPVQ
jgi:NADP-dependent 3-hydroxy acid dehydrogenase YdfG